MTPTTRKSTVKKSRDQAELEKWKKLADEQVPRDPDSKVNEKIKGTLFKEMVSDLRQLKAELAASDWMY